MKNHTNSSGKILFLGTGVGMLLLTLVLFPSSEQNFLALSYFKKSYEIKAMMIPPSIPDYDDKMLQIPILPVLEQWELCFPRDCESELYNID
jgi:hypothetical protein